MPKVSNFVFRPLQGDEIRLARIRSATDESFELSLEHWHIDNAPDYLALSYVWGDPRDTKPVILNGNALHITQNLFKILSHLKARSVYFEKDIALERGKPFQLY